MYWFDCDMSDTFVYTGVFNNERDKVGDCMTNYSEFKNLNKNQVKLLTILEQEFPDYPFYDDLIDQNWDEIVILGIFYQEFMALCMDIAGWYNRQRTKRDTHYAYWPPESNSQRSIIKKLLVKYEEYIREEEKVFEDNSYFFKTVGLEWDDVYGE